MKMKRTNQEVDEILKNSKEYIRDCLMGKIKIPDDLGRKIFENTKDNINKYVPDLINTNWNDENNTDHQCKENQ